VKKARILVVVTTVGTQEQALDIANHLVENRLAACVNIIPGVRSIFRWKGKVDDETEFLLMAKTVEERLDAVKDAITELHAYDLPEILAYPATFAEPAFARWIVESTVGTVGVRAKV
jgi:periplasmic divalent cation tolerance protein